MHILTVADARKRYGTVDALTGATFELRKGELLALPGPNASLARTRAQLSGFSTILILTMSALGGSMFPRFLMSETMQKMGLLTFNGWALDGYLKVFWRNAAVWELWPQVLVLSILGAIFLGLARLLGRRWELA